MLASWELFVAIKYVSAAYLVWLGVRMLVSVGSAPPALEASPYPGSRGFAQGFLNPKLLLFFSALLPQFVSPDQPLAPQILILGLLAAGARLARS